MSFPLPPIPQNPVSNTHEWREWLYKVSTALKEQVTPSFNNLDFTGSSITSIRTRHHNDLQELQGGQSGEQYHMTKALWTQVNGFFNYGQWYSTANQTFAATTATQINLDTTVSNVGMSISSNTVTITNPGTYNITYSIQLANPDTQIKYASFWFRKNGTDVVGSASKFNIPNSHGGLDGYTVAMSNLIVTLAAGDTIQLFGAVENALVYIETYAAQTTPFAMPSIPGSILTIQQVA